MNELTLLQRIGRGDREAVAPCIDRYSGLVWSLVRRSVANEADAEEVVQEVFMDLWKSAARFDPAKAGEATYIAMLTRRRVIDRLRRVGRQPEQQPLDDQQMIMSADTSQMLEASVETQRVLKVIQTLRPDQQKVLYMSTWLGMSHGAIATETGMPLGTVKTALRRSLQEIRRILGCEKAVASGNLT